MSIPGLPASLLVGVVLFLQGCRPAHHSTPATSADLPPAKVRAEVVQARLIPVTHDVVGTIRSRHFAEIASKISGRILELPVELGAEVRTGDVLAVIDSSETEARLEQAEVALRQVEIDHQRVDKLRQTGAATAAEYDTLNSRMQAARAAVAEARALLEHSRITAPLGGVIARKDAEPGDLAMPGKPLMRVEDPRQLRLEAHVPVSFTDQLMVGTKISVMVEGAGKAIEASVAEMAPVADAATRTFLVKFDLPAADGLVPGQFGRVAIPLGETPRLIVPSSAIVLRGQLEMVLGVKDGRARLRIVRTGRRLGEGIEILAGLSAGESIVIEDAASLVDGQPLEVR
jgi:RND family efflux transporter MFP subunit